MWRMLEDKNADPRELQQLAEEEQPGGFLTDLLSPKALVSRRSFVQGSSIAALAAGLQGCVRRPENEILPYSKAPEYLVPGVPSHFATVTSRGRDSLGVVVTNHDGRPTKVEGNEQHTRSLGGTDVRAQAYIWDLYDPDRSQSPAQRRGNALANVTDADFDKALKALVTKHKGDEGAGLRFLAPISNSPSFRRMRGKVRRSDADAGSAERSVLRSFEIDGDSLTGGGFPGLRAGRCGRGAPIRPDAWHSVPRCAHEPTLRCRVESHGDGNHGRPPAAHASG
ncbi:MAG: twin-arginine translocation signal domain-containing protein [Deltaproteobacteria bacterium]|nr:twin-arginine translocation signal domain-containing protein [Deltaproteobacteria bacterium]